MYKGRLKQLETSWLATEGRFWPSVFSKSLLAMGRDGVMDNVQYGAFL